MAFEDSLGEVQLSSSVTRRFGDVLDVADSCKSQLLALGGREQKHLLDLEHLFREQLIEPVLDRISVRFFERGFSLKFRRARRAGFSRHDNFLSFLHLQASHADRINEPPRVIRDQLIVVVRGFELISPFHLVDHELDQGRGAMSTIRIMLPYLLKRLQCGVLINGLPAQGNRILSGGQLIEELRSWIPGCQCLKARICQAVPGEPELRLGQVVECQFTLMRSRLYACKPGEAQFGLGELPLAELPDRRVEFLNCGGRVCFVLKTRVCTWCPSEPPLTRVGERLTDSKKRHESPGSHRVASVATANKRDALLPTLRSTPRRLKAAWPHVVAQISRWWCAYSKLSVSQEGMDEPRKSATVTQRTQFCRNRSSLPEKGPISPGKV